MINSTSSSSSLSFKSLLRLDTLTGLERRWTNVVTLNPGDADITLCTPSGTLHPLCCILGNEWAAVGIIAPPPGGSDSISDRFDVKLLPEPEDGAL